MYKLYDLVHAALDSSHVSIPHVTACFYTARTGDPGTNMQDNAHATCGGPRLLIDARVDSAACDVSTEYTTSAVWRVTASLGHVPRRWTVATTRDVSRL